MQAPRPLALSLSLLALACLSASGPASRIHAAEAGAVPLDMASRSTTPLPLAGLEAELVERHGEGWRPAIRRGLAQVAARWRAEDGDAEVFAGFVRTHFAGTTEERDRLFERFQRNLELAFGHGLEVVRGISAPLHVEDGRPVTPVDELFAAWDPTAHVLDDLFGNKLAFVALLNFPLTSLEERAAQGAGWTRRQWAETNLAEIFRERVPASAARAVSEASAAAERYIAGYNLWMHHVTDARGRRLFPAGKRLLSHWNLRDEIRASYAAGRDGLARQRVIQRAMERIVAQEIPRVVIDNPAVDWNPFSNAVTRSPVDDRPEGLSAMPLPEGPIDATREPDTRYALWLANFHAQREVDRFSPGRDTLLARIFEGRRQLSEARVEAMLEAVLGAPEVREVAALIRRRLGRPLEPFDIWYAGFRPLAAHDEAELDRLVAARYPDVAAFQRDLPGILERLGFTPQRARYLADHIEVDPARGSGHAWGAALRGAKARLRTRFEPGGMNYKGYNIAIHELCHNVEQVFSLNDVEYYTLNGVPNTAFTEALAFTCQHRDLEVLGVAGPDPEAAALRALDTFWGTYEIAGVALVDMRAWRFMYANPDATPAQLREAVLSIAREVWNRWYAPVFGGRDVILLAIYSHLVNNVLYLPDYPLGHLIAFQVEAQMEKAGDFGAGFERMARIGAVAPDLWMQQATGAPVGPEALLAATRRALQAMR
ncbi:MAG: hypothetical protein DIU62_009090 [Pseudomonadota bacterium]|jgi:hypothetical protein|nr:MAG: hypothetical protein DIU62_11570 [Pseudomonadota bacterium]